MQLDLAEEEECAACERASGRQPAGGDVLTLGLQGLPSTELNGDVPRLGRDVVPAVTEPAER
jgi:hypothetical protein